MLERGIRRSPSVSVLKRLARALGVPVGELLE
jgi:transcriptional regulator with XRE-family HTH domain